MDGKTFRPPKYFDKVLKDADAELHSEVITKRMVMAKELELLSIRDNPNKLKNREACIKLRRDRIVKELL